jgi:hypothetical protein
MYVWCNPEVWELHVQQLWQLHLPVKNESSMRKRGPFEVQPWPLAESNGTLHGRDSCSEP